MKMKFLGAKDILNVDDNIDDLIDRSEEIDIIKESELKSEIVLALKKTIEKNNLVSLSAPAIGYKKRIFCIKFQEEIKTFINPVITTYKGLQLSRERCTSIPNKEFIIPRNNDILVTYQRANGSIESRQIVGLAALIFQHELNHLDGMLLSDIGLELDDDWDKASDEERREVINLYLDSLDMRNKEIQKDIESDEEVQEYKKAIDFMTSIYTGETTLENTTNK